MSEKYKFNGPEGTYLINLSIVGWIDVFTRTELKGASKACDYRFLEALPKRKGTCYQCLMFNAKSFAFNRANVQSSNVWVQFTVDH